MLGDVAAKAAALAVNALAEAVKAYRATRDWLGARTEAPFRS